MDFFVTFATIKNLNSMEDTNRFHELSEELYDAVKEYLAHHTQYPTDVVMAINWDTKEIKMDSPGKIAPEFSQYSMADFIKINEQGLYEPMVF
jgi:hypothetical protein